MGPHLGWLDGWAIIVTDIIVMAAWPRSPANYTFLLFGWDSAAELDTCAHDRRSAVVWIALMTLDLLTSASSSRARTQRCC